MAASAVFNLASNILSTITSQVFDKAFEKAYERGISIWEARDELAKLRVTIETIQAVLLDAERKQESSAAVKNWIKRLKGVLYDADDLFDEVATDDLLNQEMMKDNIKLPMKRKVWDSFSKLNTSPSRDSIAKQVKAIRESLLEISKDMRGFEFVSCVKEEEVPKGLRRGQDPGCFVDPKEVIGRDEDKKAILEMLFNESDNANPNVPVVISVVGIGGMGKTTLAQLIYNDEEVKIRFEKRWLACISDISDEKQVLGKIFQSICPRQDYSSFDVGDLQTRIRESIEEGKKFLLILDDVWDDDRARWQRRMNLLGGAAIGSKIIVTTRSPLVARVVGSLKIHHLEGLSDDESWSLFKRVAFTPEQENDPRWTNLGREIVKKSRNVPLAIRSIGSLLFEKNTIREWESIRDEKLPRLGQSPEDGIMPVLKLSYDHLRSDLKQCFAYCSLFSKDYEIVKQDLIYLWMAQGYVMQNSEDMGHSNFMDLLRRGFFQAVEQARFGEISICKMHDLIHDLALHVAGEESTNLASTSWNTGNCTRHVSIVGFEIDESWALNLSRLGIANVCQGWESTNLASTSSTPLLNAKRLRSCLLMFYDSICSAATVDQLFAHFKKLRALKLSRLGIENVSSAIGELKHLRYLDLSDNNFETLPDSVTNLVNLLTLDISWCRELKALPYDFRKLINLRCLDISQCTKLEHMPGGIEKMSCLQYLSDFKVGKAATEVEEGVKKRSGLDQLATFQDQLRGRLSIEFNYGIDEEKDWDLDESRWKLPVSPQYLSIYRHPGKRIPDWDINGRTINNLASLLLRECFKVKYLPPLRCLPNLRYLSLWGLTELEYVEEEENECIHNNASSSIFFPRLEELTFSNLPRLKRWWRKVASTSSTAPPHFPLLSQLSLDGCPEVAPKYFPLFPHLRDQCLDIVDGNEVIQQQVRTVFDYSISPSSPASTSPPAIETIYIEGFNWLEDFKDEAFTSLRSLKIHDCNSLKSLHLASPHLQKISIWACNELVSFELLVEAPTTSLRVLKILDCRKLKNLQIAGHLNALEELTICGCEELELWESPDKSRCHLDWDSFTNLRKLQLYPLPPPEKLPHCIRQCLALGQLNITDEFDESLYSDGESLDSEGV